MRKSAIVVTVCIMLLPTLARAGEWYEKIKLKSDFRHRHELIQEEDREDRNRWRIRFRLSLNADVSDAWSVGARFATGSDDPVSTNQTLTDGFSTKGFHLDRAYFDFHPASVKGLRLIGGKMGLPFAQVQKTELIWDGDLSPEGAAVEYKNKASDKVEIMFGAGFFYITERKAEDDTYMGGAQLGLEVKPAEDMHLMIGGGYYDYQQVKGYPGVYDEGDFFGNSNYENYEMDSTDVYMWDYNLFEVLGELGVKMEKVSITVYGDFVTNTGSDSLNTGWLFGGSMSHGKGQGSFKLYANYRELERDAVLGVYTDSDFLGGGTDGKGLEIGASYGVADMAALALTYFINKKGIEEEADYKRLQADLQVKF
jgi:hypothetical protein